ncbi:hypothetical protein DV515_00007736 [Chloebia gouldiae]|uniref:Uncharacterized protein n=1 Tax=Chloebia gouldiae TaxID=44316 RepID=A0A3L8SGN2_CHLGU|nr:hypothetical protein DV515_00007736 [Chloebia gouldiae]
MASAMRDSALTLRLPACPSPCFALCLHSTMSIVWRRPCPPWQHPQPSRDSLCSAGTALEQRAAP